MLHEDTEIGHRCIIHSGVVIGSHGFGYSQVDGRHVPSPQLGRVVIGNDVEIGANSTIDRGTYGTTRIGDGTKNRQLGTDCPQLPDRTTQPTLFSGRHRRQARQLEITS